MTATERLRQLLDERGVEWWEVANDTRWEAYDAEWRATENGDGKYLLVDCQDCILPEEAVEATLGRGTCKVIGHGMTVCDDIEFHWYALSCGHRLRTLWAADAVGMYCPECGRKIEA